METIKELEQEMKEKFDSFKTDLKISHAEGAEKPFMIPAKDPRGFIAQMLSRQLESLTLTSPAASVVVEAVKNDQKGELEICLADSYALVVKTDPANLKEINILVEKGQDVKEGQGLLSFSQEALENSRFYVTGLVTETQQEDEPIASLRVFGPFIPTPLEN